MVYVVSSFLGEFVRLWVFRFNFVLRLRGWIGSLTRVDAKDGVVPPGKDEPF